jgi:hypothetical protein
MYEHFVSQKFPNGSLILFIMCTKTLLKVHSCFLRSNSHFLYLDGCLKTLPKGYSSTNNAGTTAYPQARK